MSGDEGTKQRVENCEIEGGLREDLWSRRAPQKWRSRSLKCVVLLLLLRGLVREREMEMR